MDYSNHTELFLPLVGTVPCEATEHQSTTTLRNIDETTTSSSVSTISKSSQSTKETNSEETEVQNHHHDICITISLFVLMFIHFGLIFSNDTDYKIQGIQWSTMNISIVLFIIATYLYRHALYDIHVQHDIIMLLPECIVIIAMILVFFHYIIYTFLLLAIGKLFMASTVIVINSYRLWNVSENHSSTEVDTTTSGKSTDDCIV